MNGPTCHGSRPRARGRAGSERGSVSLLVVLMVPALLMAGGLVLDGGRQLQARRAATGAAAAAARAAAQMTADEAFGHTLDPELATARGQRPAGCPSVTPASSPSSRRW